jgi:hypothetical protein
MSQSQPKLVDQLIWILINSESNNGKCKMLRSICNLACCYALYDLISYVVIYKILHNLFPEEEGKNIIRLWRRIVHLPNVFNIRSSLPFTSWYLKLIQIKCEDFFPTLQKIRDVSITKINRLLILGKVMPIRTMALRLDVVHCLVKIKHRKNATFPRLSLPPLSDRKGGRSLLI